MNDTIRKTNFKATLKSAAYMLLFVAVCATVLLALLVRVGIWSVVVQSNSSAAVVTMVLASLIVPIAGAASLCRQASIDMRGIVGALLPVGVVLVVLLSSMAGYGLFLLLD